MTILIMMIVVALLVNVSVGFFEMRASNRHMTPEWKFDDSVSLGDEDSANELIKQYGCNDLIDINFRDVYDWDMNNGLGGGWVSDREMGLLHRYGVAREYEMVGSQTISIKWERGERVNAGAEIIPPSFKDPRRRS